MNRRIAIGALAVIFGCALVFDARNAGAWSSRSGDLGNNANAGTQSALTPESVKDLKVLHLFETAGAVNATPVLAEGLLIIGDWTGQAYVVDVQADPPRTLISFATGSNSSSTGVGTTGIEPVDMTGAGHLGEELGNYSGVQSTPTIGTVTLPGGGEELRAYVGTNSAANTLWCVNLSKVLEDRDSLEGHDGQGYFCEGPLDEDGNPPWPKSLTAPGSSNRTMNGSPMFSAQQAIQVGGETVVRDILYTPTTGLDCSNGEMWAVDAYTGELYWSFDPVAGSGIPSDGRGGVIWTTPAMNKDRTMVYVTTGNCVTKPQVGEKAESLVALDAATGEVLWWHQRRLIDTADLDIGVGPAVVDVPGMQGCNVVVSFDKDGCVYGFEQEADIPEVGDVGFDPLRTGQQRVLYRKCFVGGSLNGGFNSSNPAVFGRNVMQQAAGYPAGHIGGDDANAFAVDACTGQVQWASSDISNGRTDGAVASEMYFQLGVTRKLAGGPDSPYQWMQEITVVSADSGLSRIPEVLATVQLPAQASLGGGGLAIVDNRLYAPTVAGVAIIGVEPGSNASLPKRRGMNLFAGPYPAPVSPGLGSLPVVNPDDPYPLMLRKPGAPDTFQSLTEGGPLGILPDGVVPE